ncbi:MAG: hypothetical protein GDA43_02540 [Hormoscilla sp. SP5CHS1]|nr:hypothetical protein [Hormoscilla sp. SP5CHS1]
MARLVSVGVEIGASIRYSKIISRSDRRYRVGQLKSIGAVLSDGSLVERRSGT